MTIKTHIFLVVIAALSLGSLNGAQAAAKAKPAAFQGDYDHCLELIEAKPEEALAYAQKWAEAAGPKNMAPLHCQSLALNALGRHEEAARMLSTVALGMTDAPRADQAEAFAQVSDAWFVAGDTKRARVAIDQALALNPTVGYLMERANIRAVDADWAGVREDVSLVLSEEPNSVDALVLRASASRNLGHVASALADANRAVDIAPHNLSALLERGRTRAASMDMVGARADWKAVIDTATTMGRADDPRAEAARVYLKGK